VIGVLTSSTVVRGVEILNQVGAVRILNHGWVFTSSTVIGVSVIGVLT